jgi:hypothetical protein
MLEINNHYSYGALCQWSNIIVIVHLTNSLTGTKVAVNAVGIYNLEGETCCAFGIIYSLITFTIKRCKIFETHAWAVCCAEKLLSRFYEVRDNRFDFVRIVTLQSNLFGIVG